MLVVVLVACERPEAPPTSPPPTDAAETGVADTGAGSPTGDTGATACAPIVAEQDLSTGALLGAWRSPAGALFAVGASPSSRLRLADGTWIVDPPTTGVAWSGWPRVTGADDDTVFAVAMDGVRRRDPGGTWTNVGAPLGPGPDPGRSVRGLRVAAADDVRVVRIGETSDTPVLVRWDGAGWTEQALAPVGGAITDAAFLADGRVVVATDVGLSVVHPQAATLPTPPGLGYTHVRVANDGALVALDEALGVLVAPAGAAPPTTYATGANVERWTDAWAVSARDVWLVGERWAGGSSPRSVVVHWDGASWSTVAELPDERLQLASGGGTEVIAVGGYAHELVLAGDASGLAVDRETWAIGEMLDLAVDDVTGLAWAVGNSPTVAVFEGGAWRASPLPDLSVFPNVLAVSNGRIVTNSGNDLHVLDGGVLTTRPLDLERYFAVAAADGVLFAAGEVLGDPETIAVLRDDGAGWTPMDTTGLPPEGAADAVWADGADDLWLSFYHRPDRELLHGLAHWDGGSWSVVTDLPGPVFALRRFGDGPLHIVVNDTTTGVDGVATWDGAVLGRVPELDVPESVEDVHLLADGTWFASVEDPNLPRGERSELLALPGGGGPWTERLTGRYVALAGSATTVWAGAGTTAWTSIGCPP